MHVPSCTDISSHRRFAAHDLLVVFEAMMNTCSKASEGAERQKMRRKGSKEQLYART